MADFDAVKNGRRPGQIAHRIVKIPVFGHRSASQKYGKWELRRESRKRSRIGLIPNISV